MIDEVSIAVDKWIDEMDLPTSAVLKPYRKYREASPDEPGELEEWYEAVRTVFLKEHQLMLSIPKPVEQSHKPDFWQKDLDEFGIDQSAFNTMDFHREHNVKFNKHAWRINKIYERVKFLGILYSCVSHEEGRRNTFQKFKNLVELKFKDEADMLVKHLKKYPHLIDSVKTAGRITALNYHIRKCNEIWKKYSTWE